MKKNLVPPPLAVFFGIWVMLIIGACAFSFGLPALNMIAYFGLVAAVFTVPVHDYMLKEAG